MKHLLLLLSSILLLNCSSPEKENTKGEFDFLIGNWKRTNDSADKSTFEIWEKSANNTYLGMGFTLQNGDTVFKEEMLILKREKDWLFAVNIADEGVTPFTVIENTTNSFLCENEENEFPKRIEYKLVDTSLEAIISDDKTEIIFAFERNN